MEKDNIIGNYGTLQETENKILLDNINILKLWRKTLWDASFNGTVAYVAPLFVGICDMKDDLERFKQYTSDEVFNEFVSEYNKTMFLMDRCLSSVPENGFMPSGEENLQTLDQIKAKLETFKQENIDREAIILALSEEDPTSRKSLEAMGLDKETIEGILASGYTTNSILDEGVNR